MTNLYIVEVWEGDENAIGPFEISYHKTLKSAKQMAHDTFTRYAPLDEALLEYAEKKRRRFPKSPEEVADLSQSEYDEYYDLMVTENFKEGAIRPTKKNVITRIYIVKAMYNRIYDLKYNRL